LCDDKLLVLTGTAYDFSNSGSGKPQAHPDFDSFGCGLTRGMVQDQLGDDKKPVLKDSMGCLTSEETFNEWFRDTPGVNQMFPVTITANWDEGSKAYRFQGTPFFPLDGMGYGYEKNYVHNYGFCFELHTQFSYEAGQIFDFMGDDDVWVYIDNKLAIVLGGVHPAESQTAYLDTLGLTEETTYDLDFFFCERHYSESNLIFSTSIKLDPCGTIDSDEDGIADKCDNCPHGDPDFSAWMDDHVGPNYGATLQMSTNILSALPITISWGDGSDDEEREITSLLSVAHSYGKSGDYSIKIVGGSVSGCGNFSAEVSVSMNGKRVAPKCSELNLEPGTLGKRKRSL